jgi:carbonic anhydrase/acetyltransferase-like protein (isoleucine patch superfamily)
VIRSFQGKTPKVHPTAWVSEAAYVIGDVEIGEHSSVWPGTVIRGDTIKITLGKYVDIQDNCVIHADSDAYYGDYVTLGHGVTCHAKTISSYCLIGNGATLNDGVVLGEYSIVASGAVVLERKEFAAKSFVVGVPASAREEPTSERHHQMIKRTAENYARKAQLFKAEGLGSAPEDGGNPA